MVEGAFRLEISVEKWIIFSPHATCVTNKLKFQQDIWCLVINSGTWPVLVPLEL